MPDPAAAPHRDRVVVVAHPDDEALWLSSALGSAARIVFCFGAPFDKPAMARARRKAVAAYPLHNALDLAIPESGARFYADWDNPVPTRAGLEITEPEAAARYAANFERLVERLRPALAGCAEVYTHNPWGEYGHAEHIQVYRAVASLQRESGYRIWFSNYVAARSWPLAQQLARLPIRTAQRTVRPDAELAGRLKRLYQRHGAWTWYTTHRWPEAETLYAQDPDDGAQARQSLAGETLLDVADLRWWPPRHRKVARLVPP